MRIKYYFYFGLALLTVCRGRAMAEENLQGYQAQQQKQCADKNSKACYNLAVSFHYGEKKSEQSNKKAIYFFKKGCDLYDELACYSLASLYREDNNDVVKAEEIWKKQCARGEALACHTLGLQCETQVEEGFMACQKDAKDYLQRACLLGRADACVSDNKVLLK